MSMPSKFSRFSFLSVPLDFVLELAPPAARSLMLLIAAAISLLIIFGFSSPLGTLEERLGALAWTLSPDTEIEQRLTVVAIDEQSLAEVGPWPWSRQQLAELVTAIDNAGAQLQLHDIVYPEAKPGDEVFLSALQNASSAVIAQVPILALSGAGQAVKAGQLSHAVSGLSCGSSTSIPIANGYLAPNSNLAAVAKGHITPIIASDGSVRKAPALICVDGEAYPSLALTAFLQGSRSSNWPVTLEPGSSFLDPSYILSLDDYPGLNVPLDNEGNMRISYGSDPSVYRAISAADVLNGNADASLLENAWVLVGATAFGMGDIVPTPYSGAVPGVELQARMLGSLLDVDVPYTPRGAVWILVLVSLIYAAGLNYLARFRGRVAAIGLPVAAILLPLLALTLHIQILHSLNVWLGWLYPAVFGICASSLLLLQDQGRVRLEQGRVFGNLNSYLPEEIAREIAFSLPSSDINAQRRNVTLLNADLRNFSAFAEIRPPEESAAVLHFFFTKATEIIEHHGGRVHEFKGDGLLSVWEGNDSHAGQQALNAAQEMQYALHNSLIQDHSPNGLEPLALGIGIEQGPVLIGSIGPAHRRSHTLLGETVGIVLRIQEMTAELAHPILLGECVARQLGDEELESQGSYLLSGLTIPHVLFARKPTSELSQDDANNNQPDLKLLLGGRR